jgi:tRNA-specific 2-thiouridylase
MKKVFVGLSGGVDSSVTAALLKEQGFDVTGVYMKNWSKDLPGYPCPWKEDYQDAKRVAVQLGIPFKMFDFENEYFSRVVQYMLDGFTSGITPNPDVMCNQEIKFKLFLEASLEQGADFVATGHYARTEDGKLLMATDNNKDQTYFLYRVAHEALQKTLFPLGGHTKPEVRELAKKFGLVTATKKESMGICFVGKIGIREFLTQFLPPQKHGDIKNQYGMTIGVHDGAVFYTIGQRHGLNVGGGLPYYVTGKDMQKNEVYVTTDLQDPKLWSDTIRLTQMHIIAGDGQIPDGCVVRTRHRGPLMRISKVEKTGDDYVLCLEEPVRALTAGQSAVLYAENECIGGGIIC